MSSKSQTTYEKASVYDLLYIGIKTLGLASWGCKYDKIWFWPTKIMIFKAILYKTPGKTPTRIREVGTPQSHLPQILHKVGQAMPLAIILHIAFGTCALDNWGWYKILYSSYENQMCNRLEGFSMFWWLLKVFSQGKLSLSKVIKAHDLIIDAQGSALMNYWITWLRCESPGDRIQIYCLAIRPSMFLPSWP